MNFKLLWLLRTAFEMKSQFKIIYNWIILFLDDFKKIDQTENKDLHLNSSTCAKLRHQINTEMISNQSVHKAVRPGGTGGRWEEDGRTTGGRREDDVWTLTCFFSGLSLDAKTNVRDYHGKMAAHYWSGSTDVFTKPDPHPGERSCRHIYLFVLVLCFVKWLNEKDIWSTDVPNSVAHYLYFESGAHFCHIWNCLYQ